MLTQPPVNHFCICKLAMFHARLSVSLACIHDRPPASFSCLLSSVSLGKVNMHGVHSDLTPFLVDNSLFCPDMMQPLAWLLLMQCIITW